MNSVNSITAALDKLKEVVDTTSVLGEKIVTDDMTIIPVSKVDVGFAGGGADMTDARHQKKNSPVGTGAKISLTPLTFLVLDKDGAHLLNINASKPTATEQIVNAVFDKLKEIKTEKEYIIEE
ncbi:MAG: hypothetical protein E7531_04010 [Ruminococcaceae bacterium]|nr:hypothetical protein [Oscillospiraceae bacterium]